MPSEALERSVKPFAQRSAHVTLPRTWVGRQVLVTLIPSTPPPGDAAHEPQR